MSGNEKNAQANSVPAASRIEMRRSNPSNTKVAKVKEKLTAKQKKIRDKNNPPGGYDNTPIPPARDGYTVRFTFHRAENLPVSDLNSLSSNLFILATLTSPLPKRHKEDPDMILRTPTEHKNSNPQWNTEWIIAGVPSSGFRLKCRLYNEDPLEHDDQLGNVTVTVNHIDKNWPGIQEENFPVKKRLGSKRAYLIRGYAPTLSRNVHINRHLFISAEVLGESDKPYGRMYTVGKTCWTKHYSPMIGRLTGTKAPRSLDSGRRGEKPVEKYE
jgi:C2 domain